MTDDLVAWLRAQIDADEAIALATIDATHRADPPRWVYADDRSIRDDGRNAVLRVKHTWNHEAAHITRHDPARVLRDIAAKRRMIDALAEAETNHGSYITATYTSRDALLAMAAVYAERDGYEEAITA